MINFLTIKLLQKIFQLQNINKRLNILFLPNSKNRAVLFQILIIICYLFGFNCAANKSTIKNNKKDNFDSIFEIKRTDKLDETKTSAIILKIDSLCNNEISVTSTNELEQLQQKVEDMFQWNNSIAKYARKTENYYLTASLSELKFRLLSKTQTKMKEAFNNKKGEKKRQEVHGNWVFQQQVSSMLPYIQTNENYSKTKTKCLFDVMNLLPEIKNKQEKLRSWLAIERMLNEIDIQKSESGYKPFQQSGEGLIVKEGQILAVLNSLHENETDEDILIISSGVLKKVIKDLNSRRDKKFWNKVEWSKEVKQRFDSEKTSHVLKSALITKNPNALDWFEKGYYAEDQNLKIEYYSKVIEIDPNYGPAYNNRGNAFQALNKDSLAILDYSKTIDLEPDYEPAYINRGNIYQKTDKHEEAINDYNQAIALKPQDKLAYFHRGNSYKNTKKYIEAVKDYTKTIKLDSLFISAYNSRGDVYRNLGKYELAIQDCDKTIELQPNYAPAYNSRGMIYKKSGKHRKAILDLMRAIEISPNYATAYFNLGCVYWDQKKWKSVISAWEKSLEINPNQPVVIKWLKKAKAEESLVEYRKLREKNRR